MNSRLEVSEARRLLDYDPHTGVIRWKEATGRGGRATAGSAAGTINSEGYVVVRIRGRDYRAHQLAFFLMKGRWPTAQVDHVNGVRSDNRMVNLREATHEQNAANSAKRRDSRAPFKGIRAQRGKWVARIKDGGREYHIGTYETAEEASAAYHAEAVRRRGVFAERAGQ